MDSQEISVSQNHIDYIPHVNRYRHVIQEGQQQLRAPSAIHSGTILIAYIIPSLLPNSFKDWVY